ncbi:MAG: phage antirepressor KilAC domain-containing protein [Firmicutes bacterium]|nr:phage antirepressor KilAC domain-containing protein [Bacillota bacterium]
MNELIKAENGLQVFENEKFGRVRVVTRDNEPWFVAKDVAEALGYSESTGITNLFANVPEEWTGVQPMNTRSENGVEQRRNVLCISEQGLYFFLARSDKPAALPFQKWLAGDVLPAIRKSGSYSLALPDFTNPAVAARAWADQYEGRCLAEQKSFELEQKIKEDRPKVVFADSVEVSKTSILTGELAKLVKQTTGCNIGQNRLFEWLRDHGYLHKSGSQYNGPTQKSMDMGLMEVKEGTRIGSSGEIHITRTTKITGKGQIYFVNLFKNRQERQEKRKNV